MMAKYSVDDSITQVQKFINSLNNEDKDVYEFIRDSILAKNPGNNKNDKAYHILSSVDKYRPIMLYKKRFIVKYRLDLKTKEVFVMDIEHELEELPL